MGKEAYWDTFVQTGKVSDYLAYAGFGTCQEQTTDREKPGEEARGRCEGTCDGNGALGSYHW